MGAITSFSVTLEKTFIDDSDKNIPLEIIVNISNETLKHLKSNALSPKTVRFEFDNGTSNFHCLAVSWEKHYVPYTIRDEKIKILAVRNKTQTTS